MSEENVDSEPSDLGRPTGQSIEEDIVSKVNELSSALLDTSFHIHSLNSRIQEYQLEQNATVDKLREDLNMCLKQIKTGSSSTSQNTADTIHSVLQNSTSQVLHNLPETSKHFHTSIQRITDTTLMSDESPTSPWRMLGEKEKTIIELERKNKELKSKCESLLEKWKTKCSQLSLEVTELNKEMKEKSKELLGYEDKCKSFERKIEDQVKEISRLRIYELKAQEFHDLNKSNQEKILFLEEQITGLKYQNSTDRSTFEDDKQKLSQDLVNAQQKLHHERTKVNELQGERDILQDNYKRLQAEKKRCDDKILFLTSQLSEQDSKLEGYNKKFSDMTIECSHLKDANAALENELKLLKHQLHNSSLKEESLQNDLSLLRKRMEQKEKDVTLDLSQSVDTERLNQEKKELEAVCLNLSKKYRKQIQQQKTHLKRINDLEQEVTKLREVKHQNEKQYQEFIHYFSEKIDFLVGILCLKSSETFQAFCKSENTERYPVLEIAEIKGKLQWLLQEIRNLIYTERSDRVTAANQNKTQSSSVKK